MHGFSIIRECLKLPDAKEYNPYPHLTIPIETVWKQGRKRQVIRSAATSPDRLVSDDLAQVLVFGCAY